MLKKLKIIVIMTLCSFFLIYACPRLSAGAETAATASAVFDELARQSGNQTAYARLITDNNEAWYARWNMISGARKTIDVTYFIIKDDIFGKSMLGLLLKKAREGVKIRLMMDARGSGELTRIFAGVDYLQELLETPGVEIKVYNPVNVALRRILGDVRNAVLSNHDKILLIDGETAMTGGRNISEIYFADPRDCEKVYRDADVFLKGRSVAARMKTAFDEEFSSHQAFNVRRELFGNIVSRSEELELARRAMQAHISGMDLSAFAASSNQHARKFAETLSKYKHMRSYQSYDPLSGLHPYPVIVLDKHSRRGTRNDITPGISAFLKTAVREVLIQNFCIILSPEALASLKAATDRGVALTMLTNSPKSAENILSQAFFLEDWKVILSTLKGSRLFAYDDDRQLHSKIFVFDGELTVVGSYNMDYLSEQINSEIAVVIKSKEFARRASLRVLNDISAYSVEYKIGKDKNGKITASFGPENHTDKKKIDLLKKLKALGFLKPLF